MSTEPTVPQDAELKDVNEGTAPEEDEEIDEEFIEEEGEGE
jgi:hypothetical protein